VLSLPPSVRLFVATQPVDGRKGTDSLMILVRNALGEDPLSGHLYVFFSKRRDRVRIVYWDRSGFAMWTKRLEQGRFHARFRTQVQTLLCRHAGAASLKWINSSTSTATQPPQETKLRCSWVGYPLHEHAEVVFRGRG